MIYGRRPQEDGVKGQKIGVVIASYAHGEVAHILYCGASEPLYLVPSYVFKVSPAEASTMSKQEYAKRTTNPLSISSNVEFGVEEKDPRIVRWFRKCPSYMAVDFEKTRPRIMSEGVTNGQKLWTRKFGLTGVPVPESLASVPVNVPLQVWFEIDVNYGEGFNERRDEVLPLQGFRPTTHFLPDMLRVVDQPDDEQYNIVREAPWNQHLPQRVGTVVYDQPVPPINASGGGGVAAFTRDDLMLMTEVLNDVAGKMHQLALMMQRQLDNTCNGRS